MTPEEIREQAWREIIVGAQSYRADWIDEEGEYTEDDAQAIRAAMGVILADLQQEHP